MEIETMIGILGLAYPLIQDDEFLEIVSEVGERSKNVPMHFAQAVAVIQDIARLIAQLKLGTHEMSRSEVRRLLMVPGCLKLEEIGEDVTLSDWELFSHFDVREKGS